MPVFKFIVVLTLIVVIPGCAHAVDEVALRKRRDTALVESAATPKGSVPVPHSDESAGKTSAPRPEGMPSTVVADLNAARAAVRANVWTFCKAPDTLRGEFEFIVEVAHQVPAEVISCGLDPGISRFKSEVLARPTALLDYFEGSYQLDKLLVSLSESVASDPVIVSKVIERHLDVFWALPERVLRDLKLVLAVCKKNTVAAHRFGKIDNKTLAKHGCPWPTVEEFEAFDAVE